MEVSDEPQVLATLSQGSNPQYPTHWRWLVSVDANLKKYCIMNAHAAYIYNLSFYKNTNLQNMTYWIIIMTNSLNFLCKIHFYPLPYKGIQPVMPLIAFDSHMKCRKKRYSDWGFLCSFSVLQMQEYYFRP